MKAMLILTVRDRNRADYQVLLTDQTSIKTKGGFWVPGRSTRLLISLRGLIVEVEGRGDAQGQLVAEKVRFKESDLRAAVTTDTRVLPLEENQKRIAGQIDELHSIAAEARSEVRAAHERITALDDYDVQESVTVNFSLNSAVLSAEAKQRLDALAEKAINARSYTFEVGGYTDSTGGEAVNFRLSRQRAEAVVQYLAVNHKIPLRRFVNPDGVRKDRGDSQQQYSSGPVAESAVEVKMLLNRGMNQTPVTSSSAKP